MTDIAGRTTSVTDAAGNTTTTAYDAHHDAPATITDALGNTTCYRYVARGRKVAEWGTGIQPACIGYDDAGNMVTLTTYRGAPATNADGSPGQSVEGAAAGDVTTWTYDPATGLELCKTYADQTSVSKSYDAFNRLATEINARGKMKCHAYEHARGLLLGTTYYHAPQDGEEPVTDSLTPARSYAYNHLGQLTQVTDAAGTRTISYNQYGEQDSDSLVVDGDTHLITETRDAQGRSTGYVYSKNGATQQTVTTVYGADGRINSAGFVHGGSEKKFSYEYLPGTHLLQKLTLPSNMTLTQSYEEKRDLLTGMHYKRGNTGLVERSYSYDTLGRPLTRCTARNGQTENDCFGYNNRSELTTATVNGGSYAYDYDNIGNRLSSQSSAGAEADAAVVEYTANELNQYTALSVDGVTDFQPEYDADGNQTRVKTSTGIWAISYDTENRPTDFTSMAADNTITTVHCEYDSMGRRAIKRVMVNGNVTLQQRYIYRGYLQIACIDLTRSHHPALWYITWDPTQPIATRPLAIQKDATWYTYGWDLTKNICEVYRNNGTLGTSYTYTPYGLPSQSTNGAAAGSVEQPIQWSSEFNDTELGLIYYNYRHYNPADGRWMGRDRIHERGGVNMYAYTANRLYIHDYLGNALPALLLIVLSRAAIDAGAGVISRIAGDVIEWKLSSFSKYVAAAVGGAIGNTLKNYTWSFAASSFVEAALNNLMGDDKSTPCQFMADVALNAVIMKSGMKYIEMPHLSSSIKDILGRMNMNFNLILVNIYKSGGNGLQNKIYKFAKKIYYELPGSAPATILRSSVTRGMEMKPVQLELDEINDSFHQYQQYQEYYQEENRYFWEHYGFPHMLNIKQ